MIQRNANRMVRDIIDSALTARGFARSGLRWFRDEGESILLVEIQPARYAPGPYINFAVYYRHYGEPPRLHSADFHVNTRLESVVPLECVLRVDSLVDPNSALSDEARQIDLNAWVVEYGLPWLAGLTRWAEARAFLARRTSKGVFIAPAVRSDLEPPESTGERRVPE